MSTVRNLAFALLAGGLALGMSGCGGGGYAPVSGVVTMNGKPLRNVVVLFLPEQTKEHAASGRGSSGHTDENGHFTLKSVDGHAGAAVGKHHVRINSVYSKELKGYEAWDAEANKVVKAAVDPIPPEWSSANNKKEFDVPSGGTDKANFEIVTRKTPKR
jgi:hypothetical protein